MIPTTRNLLALAALLAPAVQAQTLMALEDGNMGGVPRIHEITLGGQIINTCTLPAAAGILPIGPTLGSLAYSRGGAISTDGVSLVTTDLACNLLQSCPIPGFYNALAADDTGTLYFNTANTISGTNLGCPQGPVQFTCLLPAPLLAPLVGMEWDSQAGTLWVVDAGGTIAELFIQQLPVLCRVLRSFPMRVLPGQPAAMPESIAVNPCTQQIFLTDTIGNLIVMTMNGIPQGAFPVQGLAPGAFLVGLSRRPAQAVSTGGGCTALGCPNCAVPQAFTTGGDPVLGNLNFRIEVRDAPFDQNGPSIAILVLDFTPGPLNVGLCGPLQVGLSPNAVLGNLGNVLPTLMGPVPCNGATFAGLPIPNLPQLCGVTLFAQWGLVCTANGGISLSNGLKIPIN